MKELYERSIYTVPGRFIIGNYMYEYDIRQANISILHTYGILSDTQYHKLQQAPKIDREIMVGKIMERRNGREASEIASILEAGFAEYRRRFIEENKILDSEIIEIRKDSILVLGHATAKTEFGDIVFVKKNTYTSYYNLGFDNLVLLYSNSGGIIDSKKELEVKGIKKEKLIQHKGYMFDLLKKIVASAEKIGLLDVILMTAESIQLYTTRNYNIGYYREFNANSAFCIQCGNDRFAISEISNPMTEFYELDVSYNYRVLNTLYKMFMSKYL